MQSHLVRQISSCPLYEAPSHEYSDFISKQKSRSESLMGCRELHTKMVNRYKNQHLYKIGSKKCESMLSLHQLWGPFLEKNVGGQIS